MFAVNGIAELRERHTIEYVRSVEVEHPQTLAALDVSRNDLEGQSVELVQPIRRDLVRDELFDAPVPQ